VEILLSSPAFSACHPDNLPRPASADGLVKTELPIDHFSGHPGNLPGR